MSERSKGRALLADHTTIGVGGPATRLVEAGTAAQLSGLVAAADTEGTPVLILAGGSNVVISDDGFDGLVVKPTGTRGTRAQLPDGSVLLDFEAGRNWDELVEEMTADGLSGIEALSGIPGSLGAAPLQNIGAYGQELSETLRGVKVYDRKLRHTKQFSNEDCRFSYRNSIFRQTDRYVILSVQLQLEASPLSRPVAYGELARKLGVKPGDRVPLSDLRAAVLELRRGKGMVIDPADPDTRSAGSFFLNPIVKEAAAAQLPEAAPRWPAGTGLVKLSAAWLIERAGFSRGYSGDRSAAALSGKHTLAITNRGGATATDIVSLAAELRDGVLATFGIELVPEPRLIGISLPRKDVPA